MENLELKVETGLKRIKANEYGDVILINVSDASVFERFAKVYDNVMHVSDEFKKDIEQHEKQFGEDNTSREAVVSISKVNVKYIGRCIEELETAFGKDSIYKAFRESYDNIPDFVPDESLLLEFMNGMVPIMEKLFNEKINKDKSRYSVGFKGKRK